MAVAYATFADLQARWPGIPDSSQDRAEALLEDAAVILDTELPPVPDAEGEVPDARVRRLVSCSMVERILKGDGMAHGVTQGSRTMGPFSESVTFSNPNGDLYLTKGERKLLGVGRQRAFTIDMAPPPVPHDLGWSL